MRKILGAILPVLVTAALLPVALATRAVAPAYALDNGLARTPPMGWNPWNALGPPNCATVTAQMVEQNAKAMATSGMQAAGYQYVNIDECWEAKQRDASGSLQTDPNRFPGGIKPVADYVHSLGLKLGIYEDPGTQTCNGYPGDYGHEAQDARTFASWGVDYLKDDSCNIPTGDFPGTSFGDILHVLYSKMRDALAATGRPITFSVGGGAYYPWDPDVANLWRTTNDIANNWYSVLYNADHNTAGAAAAGPGHWNDPDMLEADNGGSLTPTEVRSEFSLWAISAAPLIVGTDLRTLTAAAKQTLTNPEVIAVDQDQLGVQGTKITSGSQHDIWTRPLADGSRAVLLVNRGELPTTMTVTASQVGLPAAAAYQVRDLWAHQTTASSGAITAAVDRHGVAMLRITPLNKAHGPATTSAAALPRGLDYPPGTWTPVPLTFTNSGTTTLQHVTLSVAAPAGWQVQPGPPVPSTVAAGATVTSVWQVMPPATGKPGWTQISAQATGDSPGGPAAASSTTTVDVPPAPPGGTDLPASHLTPTLATATATPLAVPQVDHSADGNPLTVTGHAYPDGYGVQGWSDIGLYLGRHCSSLSADVGVDDDSLGGASDQFQVYADGYLLYDSGKLHRGQPPTHLNVPLTGVTSLRLHVEGNLDEVWIANHGDWLTPRLQCTTSPQPDSLALLAPATTTIHPGTTADVPVMLDAFDTDPSHQPSATFSVTAPTGWTVTPGTGQFSLPTDGGIATRTVPLQVSVPAGTAPGSYHLAFTGRTDTGLTATADTAVSAIVNVNLYGFEDGTSEGWQPGQNVDAVAPVSGFANGPGHCYDGSDCLDGASTAALPASAWRTMFVAPASPLDLSQATAVTAYIDCYGGAPAATGYQAVVTLTGADGQTLTNYYPISNDTWNRLSTDVSNWAPRNAISRIEIGFQALGSANPWGGVPHYQIDDVGWTNQPGG